MTKNLFRSYGVKSFGFIFTIVLLSFFIVGSCSDNNGTDLLGTTSCMPFNAPCSQLTTESGGAFFSCVLDDGACGVNLSQVISQVTNEFTTVTDDTIMWIEAWGGNGGSTDKGTSGGSGGYSVTTTTVSDIASKNSNSTEIFYFLGFNGPNGGDHCGSSGGASTIVTLEDLTLNPTMNPTDTSPPNLLIAGGAGGGAGGNESFGCANNGMEVTDGKDGGVAIAQLNITGEGFGGGNAGSGSGGSEGFGGPSQCSECGGGDETSGKGMSGGLGGPGGSGQSCGGPGIAGFRNTGVTELPFTAGEGGQGSSNTSTCDSGGAGGGGGWGGGGGGGHGNDNGPAFTGGGGGSLAIASTQSSNLSPTGKQDNPCGSQGCVRISFVAP